MDAPMYLIIHRSSDGVRQVITRERDWFMTVQAKKYYEGFHGKGHIFIDFIKWLNQLQLSVSTTTTNV